MQVALLVLNGMDVRDRGNPQEVSHSIAGRHIVDDAYRDLR
jgi:hypothetical protein